MLSELAENGRLDLLRALRDHKITLAALHHEYQRKTLHKLPRGNTARPLIAAMREWMESLEVSAKHASSLETSRRYLERARPNALIAELPDILEELSWTLGRTHPRSFNITRSAASAFVRRVFRRSHPLYLEVNAVEFLPVTATRGHHPLTVAEMRSFFAAPAVDPLDAIT